MSTSSRATAIRPAAIPSHAALDDAIERARQMVLDRQRDDGSWQERGDMGPFTTALALVCLHAVGQLVPADLHDGARWLRNAQLADGSFRGRPFATEGDLATTAAAWAALSLATSDEDRAAADRAKAFVTDHGGTEAVRALASSGDVSAIALALAGLVDPRSIPTLPLSILAMPKLVEVSSRRVVFYGLTTMISSALALRGLDDAPRGLMRGLLEGREHARAIELLCLYQNKNGSLMNVVYHTALLLPALRRGARDAAGLHFDVYGSDVWSTASYLRVLLVSGSARSDAAIVRAVSWLLDEQCDEPHPELTNPAPGAPRTGGWGFQSGEDAYPDCDTTSTVLDALARALLPENDGDAPLPAALATRVCAAIASARAWLLAMQNADGGWPSFFAGHPSKRPGPMMLRPLSLRLAELPRNDPSAWVRAFAEATEHLSDPATEDVTSRVLSALAHSGSTLHEVRTALAFLDEQQCPSGAWWGRWKVNYLPVTAAVVCARAHLGDDLSRESTRRALAWIEARQNDDGGFGESVESYRDPSLAGCGPSTAPLTGSVLLGLVEAGRDGESVRRAAEYLIRRQNDDGSWPNDDCVATLVPPDLFYVYGGAARYIPLEALARHRARRS